MRTFEFHVIKKSEYDWPILKGKTRGKEKDMVSDSNVAEVEDYGETITFKDFEVLYVFTGDERKDRKAWKLLRNSMAIRRKESQ